MVQELIDKAAVLLEALPYIQRYSGATFVIKYGGSFMDAEDPTVRSSVARDIVFLEAVEINPVVVHGGGKAINRAMQAAGLEPRFVQGLRITTEDAVAIVERVLSQEINPQIVRMIQSFGGEARGFAGWEIFRCRPKRGRSPEGEEVDLGLVGEVVEVDTAPLLECIERGITPVISPTARGEDGRIYNCNADVAAAKTAIALKTRRLVFMSDVPGLLRDPADLNSVIPHLKVAEVEALTREGIISAGMIPKVASGVEAVKAGVEKVSFVDGRVPHAVLLEIFTDRGVGTEVVA